MAVAIIYIFSLFTSKLKVPLKDSHYTSLLTSLPETRIKENKETDIVMHRKDALIMLYQNVIFLHPIFTVHASNDIYFMNKHHAMVYYNIHVQRP